MPVQQMPLQQDPRWMEFAQQGTAQAGAAAGAAAAPAPTAATDAPAAVPEFDAGRLLGDVEPPPREPVLQRALSVNSHVYRVHWTVDARKLKSSDREAVSPAFELSFTRPVQFKMVIRPKTVSDQRGGASFKKAKGVGSVLVRCLDQIDADMNPQVTFRIAVSTSTHAKGEARGPVKHNFSDKTTAGLPEELAEWPFEEFVNKELGTFVICLEIVPPNFVG